jgi:PAS domain S-box-containing protein
MDEFFHGPSSGAAINPECLSAEEKLRDSEERYHSLFANMMDGFAFCKMIFNQKNKPIDFVYLEVNDNFEKITGLKRENVLGKKITQAIPGIKEGNPELFEVCGRVALTCKNEKFEIFFKQLSLWLSVSVYCPKIGYFAAIFEDITKRKQAQEAIEENEKRLNRSQEIAHLGSWELDLITNKLTWSDEVYRIFGLKPQEFGATYQAFLDAVHPEDRDAVDGAYSGSLRDGRDSYEIDHRVVRTLTGEIRVVHEKCYHMRDGSGKIIRSIGMVHDVTEQKKVEQELWQAKSDWERTFDTVPDFIAILDNNHRIVRANKAMTEQLGVTPQQAIGQSCYSCVHGTSLPPEFCPHAKTLRDGKEHVAEVHEARLGGDFLVSTTPLRDEKDTVIGSVHVARNITERKKAEEAVNKLNRHLRAISNSNQTLMQATDQALLTQEICNIIVHDCGYTLVWVGLAEHDKNKTVRPVAFAGFNKDYIDSLNITWADKPSGRGPTGTVIRTGEPYVCRNMNSDPNFKPWGEQALKRKFTASLALPLFTLEKEPFGALNIYSQEPDPFSNEEIKLLTELANDFAYGIEMLKLRKEKEQSTEVLRKQAELIDLSPDAIMVKKLDGTITFWSKGAENLYGWTKEEALGESTYSLFRTKFSDPIEDIILKLKQSGEWAGELVHRTKDNCEVVVQSWWLGKPDEQGNIREILESNVDVTDRKKIQSKLEENASQLEEYANQMEKLANERAKQLNQAERLITIGQTAGMVGHDIRNPLQAIVGELYLVRDELQSLPSSHVKKNLQESIANIEENLFYIDKIVADLQDYTKPLSPSKEKVNVAKVIEEALLIVTIPNNLEVSIKISEGFPQLTADFSMLKRVFINLIQNAVQAMPNGGSLKITAHCKDKHAFINVEDTGEGIPEEAKSKLFTPLFTTKSKGQGFGLAVVKRLIEAQGGKISFESKLDKGTIFTAQLPLT